jgi:hypothetical protein
MLICGSSLVPRVSRTLRSVIVELRQYTLRPGQRDVLIDLFDREFIEPQECAGMTLFGQFRVLDEDDCFLWLRGFPNMASRALALATFYGGPVWAAYRDDANATMIDSDNVLLLRPARTASGFTVPPRELVAKHGATVHLYVATIYYFKEAIETSFVPVFQEVIAPIVVSAGAGVCGYFVSEHAPNNFHVLPIREDENVFVWFGVFEGSASYEEFVRLQSASRRARIALKSFEKSFRRPVEVRKLFPTSGSRLR